MSPHHACAVAVIPPTTEQQAEPELPRGGSCVAVYRLSRVPVTSVVPRRHSSQPRALPHRRQVAVRKGGGARDSVLPHP